MEWIAKLTCSLGEAVLLASGEWQSADEILRECLNGDFNPKRATGVDAVMPFGRMAASRAAAKLGGKVVFAKELPPVDPDAIS